MSELRCPNCGEIFEMDESNYQQLVKQVRDNEFEEELKRRKKEIETVNENKIALEKLKQEQSMENFKHQKDTEIQNKDQMIEDLKNQLKTLEMEHELKIAKVKEESNQELSKKTEEIALLQSSLKLKETEKELSEKTLKEKYEIQLQDKDELIERYKDFKLKQSTKMVGESLEQYCSNQFNMIRMTVFPNAYFEKDNDIKTGSKGDFIFKESKDGVEFISIMFEMKNEQDMTATKHKNEDFFKELDKDRREKGCEYAVLVSMLESENDFYNTGIVDVSYRYEKMYVIRPQFFIPMITLLRNAALNSLEYQQELQIVKNQQLDIQNFEENMLNFKEAFGRNYRIASEKFKIAVEEIDKTIDHLQKTKAALLSSENNLRLANNKAEDLSIKKLTKNAPSVREMFEEKK